MSKKTEIVKSIALTVLVAMSIVLFANSWVREWSHSDSKNNITLGRFFAWSGIEKWFGYKGEVLPGTDIIAPSSVIFTSGAKRIVLNKGTDMYSKTYEDILSILLYADGFADSASEINSEEWYYVQRNKAIYLDYGVAFKREILETGIGYSLPSEIYSVDSVVLTSNDSATNKLVIYFHDPVESKYYKVLTDKSASAVAGILSSMKGYKNIPLAEELGFNTAPQEGYGQQLAINGNNVIDLETAGEKLPVYVKIKNGASALDNRKRSSLLALFGMSESSAKQYADVDVSMYIDVNGTLSFYEKESGTVMEYTAASNQKGISLDSGDFPGDIFYSMARGAYSCVYSVKDLFGISGLSLRFASDITRTGEEGFTDIYIDYCFNGLPVCFEDQGKAQHGAWLRFNSKGNLVYLKQTLYDVEDSGIKAEYLPVMTAIDSIYSHWGTESTAMYIRYINKGYRIEENSVRPVWCIRLKEDGNVYMVD